MAKYYSKPIKNDKDKEYIGDTGWFVSSTARAAAQQDPKELIAKAQAQLQNSERNHHSMAMQYNESMHAAMSRRKREQDEWKSKFNGGSGEPLPKTLAEDIYFEKTGRYPPSSSNLDQELSELRDRVLNFQLKIFF